MNVQTILPLKGHLTHALDVRLDVKAPRDLWMSMCGKDASGWGMGELKELVPYMDSGYSCRLCVKALLE